MTTNAIRAPLPPTIAASIARSRGHMRARPRPAATPAAPAFEAPAGAIVCVVPLRTCNPLNKREHWRARAKRVARERLVTLAALRALRVEPPSLPLVITLARIAPRRLDSDAHAASMKATRDEIAAWLRLADDADSDALVWRYSEQVRGPYAVRVVIERAEATQR